MSELNLQAIDETRSRLAELAVQQTALGAELAARQAELAELLRAGRATAAAQAEQRIATLLARRETLQTRRHQLAGRIGELAVELVDTTALAAAVESLDGTVPVALLPVRVETRFAEAATALHIRIFPDQIHLDAHEPAFTDDERTGAEWYWNERWPAPADAERAEVAWATLAGRFRPGRARYLIDTLRPTNLDRAPAEAPAFPPTERRASSWTRAVEAAALPERWVAIGLRGGSELFRVWSDRVPDRLAAGPSPDQLEQPPPPDPERRLPVVQDAFRWAFDPEAAREAGMLLTVHDADLAFGRLADGLTRLIVVGVDWTLTPEQGAAAIDRLLAGHAASGDLAFVAPGTATNNTGTDRSGFSTAPSEQVAAWAPPLTGADPDASGDTAATRLGQALGVGPTSSAVAPGAEGRHQAVASALIDALWEATGGYYVGEMLDPHVTDETAAEIRLHAAANLFAGGPLPSIRVGPQPYGVLPVAPRRLAPHVNRPVELAMHRIAGFARSLWEEHVDKVPRLGLAGETGDVDDVLLELLQRTPVPWSLRWREMVAPPQWSATGWLADYRARQAPWLREIVDRLGVPTAQPVRLQYLTAAPDSQPLRVPLVVKGDQGTSYLAEIAALARSGDAGRRELNLRQNSVALLEALLAFAAVQELDKAASAELFEALPPEQRQTAGFVRKGVRTPDLVRVEEPDQHRLLFQFPSARVLAAQTVPGRGMLVHDRVAERLRGLSLREHIRRPASPVNGLARFLAALEALAAVPADELEWAFRGVLDLFSTRLDAWFTSMATARLHEHRQARPTGVHVGCYGWVEDLRPDRGPEADSLGYIAAPSLAHAVSAALLRSGRQAHAGDGAFDLDLSSARVREALHLLEGVAAGQSLAALLGYRIERKLTDAGLADVIVGLRRAAPLQARAGELEQPMDAVAARDVVDGLHLLAMLPTPAWRQVEATIGITGPRRQQLEAVLTEAAGVYDAVSDVLVVEAVHQTAAGNLDRAAAATGALDRQERPVEPEVVRTPRDGAVVTNRVVVALRASASARPATWPARGVRGAAEPRLDAWLGEVFGDPALLTCGGRLVRSGVVTDLGPVSAADIGLSPLALALAANAPAADQPSELAARVALVLAGRVADPTPDDHIELVGPSLLLDVAGWAARLVSGCRPLQPSDLAPPAATGAAGTVDEDDLQRRVDRAVDAVRASRARIEGVPQTAGALRRVLTEAAELMGVDALPAPGSTLDSLVGQAAAVGLLLHDREMAIDELLARPLAPGETAVARLVALGQAALGSAQPLLAVFTLGSGAELAASIAARAELLAGDEDAPVVWLHRAGLVRPELEPLCGLLTHAEAGGSDVAGGLAVAQTPHRPGGRWCELPFGPEGPPPAGTVGVVAVAPGGLDPGRPLCGLVVDTWAEVIPAVDHTAGVTFHYDAPGARPPQVVVLAVHPDEQPGPWTVDYLVETVQEAMSLARLRTLGLRELEGLAGLLPALFLPGNYTRDVPSVSLKNLVLRAEAAQLIVPASGVRGKP